MTAIWLIDIAAIILVVVLTIWFPPKERNPWEW